jgi:RNA polymerase sigma-70 factor (ECF subfamily)
VRGAEAVGRFLVGVRRKFGTGDVIARVVNGRAALIAFADGTPQRVVSIDVSRNRIAAIYVVANPDKLRPLARSLLTN